MFSLPTGDIVTGNRDELKASEGGVDRSDRRSKAGFICPTEMNMV